MKKNLPLIVIIVSIILIAGNFIFIEKFDSEFFIATLSRVLIILSMVFIIKTRNKKMNNLF